VTAQVGTILFVLKLLMIGVDDINCQIEALGVGGALQHPEGRLAEASGMHVQRIDKLESAVADIQGDVKAILQALTGSSISKASTEAAAQAAANVPVQTLTRDVLSPEPYPSEDQPPTPGAREANGNGDGAAAAAAHGSAKADKRQLPPGWIEMWSRTKNRPYYKHESTERTSWSFPVSSAAPPSPTSKRKDAKREGSLANSAGATATPGAVASEADGGGPARPYRV